MSDNQLILNEYFQMKSKEIENSNPWLVYVAEKKQNKLHEMSRKSCETFSQFRSQ